MSKKIKQYTIIWLIAVLAVLFCSGAVFADGKAAIEAPVIVVSHIDDTGYNLVNWSSIEGASGYEVWLREGAGGEWEFFEETENTMFLHTDGYVGCKYYYCVRAINTSTGGCSEFSNWGNAACTLSRPQVTTSNDAATGCVILSWPEVPGAVRYKVYAEDLTKGTGSEEAGTTKSTACMHTSGIAGHEYRYSIIAACEDSDGNSSPGTATQVCDYEQPVLKVSTVASTGAIRIRWEASDEAATTKIYYRLGTNGTWTEATSSSKSDGNYTFSGTIGKKYYFKARSIGAANATSAYSTVVSLTRKIAAPAPKADTYKGRPKLTWSAVSGAEKYTIYRSTKSDSGFSVIDIVAVSTAKTYTYTDNDQDLKSGKIYYYKIKAVSSVSAASATSDALKIKYQKIALSATKYYARVGSSDGSLALTVTGTSKTVTWSSSDTSRVTVKGGKLTTKKTGTVTITAKVDGLTLKCTVYVLTDTKYVERFAKMWVKNYITDDMTIQEKLVLASYYIVEGCSYDSKYTSGADIVSYGKGTSKAAGQVLKAICQAMGYSATVRSTSGDKKSMYPSGISFGKNHYNVKVESGKNTYYIESQPGFKYLYVIKNQKLVYSAYKSGSSWYMAD